MSNARAWRELKERSAQRKREADAMGHGIIKCDCGAVILQCRCLEGHRNVTVKPKGCAACQQVAAPEPAS